MLILKFGLTDVLLKRRLQQFAKDTPGAAAQALNDIGARQMQEVRRRAPGGPGHKIGKSIHKEKATAHNLIVRIGSPHEGARILHYGGVIRAGSNNPNRIGYRFQGKTGRIPKNLAIPIFGNKKTPKQFDEAGIKLFVFKGKSGKWFLGQKTEETSSTTTPGRLVRRFAGIGKGKGAFQWQTGGKGRVKAGIRALFVLQPSVTIKPHPYMYWSREDRSEMQEILMEHMERVARG